MVGQIFESPGGRAARRLARETGAPAIAREPPADLNLVRYRLHVAADHAAPTDQPRILARSEEHTSELQSLMRISYAVFCLKKKKNNRKKCREKYKTRIHDESNQHRRRSTKERRKST